MRSVSCGREQQKDTLENVIALLNRLDPYRLKPGQAGGCPWDEYSLEAYPMASAIVNGRSVDEKLLDAIWVEWFSEPLSKVVSPPKVSQLVADLQALIPSEE